LTVAFWDCLVGTIVLAPTLVFAANLVPDDAGEWVAVLLLGIVFTGISTLVYAVLLRHVTAQAAGILTFLEPVAAVFLAWVFLGESLAPRAVVGGLLVLLAGIGVVALEPTESRVGEVVVGVGSLEP
jgi:DME family drug/metabolite transporter